MEKVISNIGLDILGFDDEVDCAILDDEEFNKALSELEAGELELDDDEEDVLDTDLDYSETPVEADMVSVDADDLLAAERDLAFDPFEDEELMDSISDSDDTDIIVNDEEDIEDDETIE